MNEISGALGIWLFGIFIGVIFHKLWVMAKEQDRRLGIK